MIDCFNYITQNYNLVSGKKFSESFYLNDPSLSLSDKNKNRTILDKYINHIYFSSLPTEQK